MLGLTYKGKNNPNSSFDWKDACADSAIMGALTFFTSLGGMSVMAVPSPQSIVAAVIAGCTQFFLILAMKRGLVKK